MLILMMRYAEIKNEFISRVYVSLNYLYHLFKFMFVAVALPLCLC